jgi:CubicO group peptidase (beta-lactamase class C family)
MEAKSPRRILKRPGTAQVMYAVLFEEPPYFARPLRGRLCGRQPPFHFRGQIVRRCNGIRLQPHVAKELQQFAECKRAHVRRIAQYFPSVLIRGTFRMLARVNILHQDLPAYSADSRHLAHNLQGIEKMMEREPADHYVEGPIFERKVLRISRAERNIGNPTLFRALLGDREHRIRKIDANDLARRASEGFRYVSRARRDIQHALSSVKTRCIDQSPDALLVGNPRIRRKSLRLRGKRFANDVVVLCHNLGPPGKRGNERMTEHHLWRLWTGVTMKKWMTGVLLLIGLAGCSRQESRLFPNAASVKRLDGSTITSEEIDTTVTRVMRAAKVTGVGLAIFNDDKIVYLGAYGHRNLKKNLLLTEDSVMSAASFTKVAFVYMVMQLVQEGTLNLDKPIAGYLPKALPKYSDYKDLAGDERWKKITARMLLDHTSGFPNWRFFEDDKKLHIHFEPGSRFAYSGEGIDLLQLVVEKVTKKGTGDLMRERVFEPLGMTRTSMTWRLAFESDHAEGYDEQENSLGPQRRLWADAAGSMLTTPRDFARFMQAVMQGQRLNKETRETMLSPQIAILSKHEFPALSTETTEENKPIRLSYGLAWGLYWTPYGKAFFKEGHDDGWRNYTVCFDEPKTGILIMTNSSNGESIYKELLETLLKNSYTPIEWEQFTPYNAPQ